MDDENKWMTNEPCSVCGHPYDKHVFRRALTCIMNGAETKAGTLWSQDDSDEVVERAFGRL